ncbi:metallophosphoesterase [Rubeoparvulum massiliense]|uniref:metallophosphoesterase n=1 Tax=Rubeoparvulum massiliense TaxID=1631346 RepID=UPI00065E3261|nr:metallophosphoesterase [Rubeoparvulum massiliense]
MSFNDLQEAVIDFRHLHGPFDFIGDVHGCYDEALQLLEQLGYKKQAGTYVHPSRRRVVFLGDITDRGPKSLPMIALVYSMWKHGSALYIHGNHCDKLYRFFQGRNIQAKHGIETTIAELERVPIEIQHEVKQQFIELFEQTPLYLQLDEGKVIAVHGALKEEGIGRYNQSVRKLALYGDITGERDEHGLPIRRNWAATYKGDPWIIYGHQTVPEPLIQNHTINIDQGCATGGYLTAFRYPEMEISQVKAKQVYYEKKTEKGMGPIE